MSFRVRVLVLVVFLVAISTAATAWLTVRQATRELTESVAATQRDITTVVDELAAYGRTHGTWHGVATTVGDLSDRLGQRLRLVTEAGAVLADSDVLRGGTARPVNGAPVAVDPRPDTPTLDGSSAELRHGMARKAATAYEDGWRYAACLTRAGIGVRLTTDESGMPTFAALGDSDRARTCRPQPREATDDALNFATNAQLCTERRDDRTCLAKLLDRRIGELAPAPLRLYLGAVDEAPFALSGSSIAVAAGAVVLAAGLTALLLSRRVVRPISALTTAAARLGSGDLAERVPVTGRDEIAGLAKEFNRMAASLADSEERQRRLIADVAHELRTPLANLRGYLEALADGVLRPDPELFASLLDEALLQQRIVDDLQDLALAEAGALAYHRGRVDLAELVEVCRTAHAAVADTARVSLTVSADSPVEVEADPDRLRQVIGNLVRNAIAATPAGGRVAIDSRVVGQLAIVEVRDTGRGIAPEDLPHVFDRLWRADNARARSGGGSGLGLAIAWRIVTDHGGTIQVASTVGQGTRVTVSLPAVGILDNGAPR
ncbi:sensor histidine kinase [Luedemannella helvata]|uniref:histidine kinase n=1 Tax=Luedemannella helvata TaxID=349315 RepID=A0ABN2KXZ6_9ACTN